MKYRTDKNGDPISLLGFGCMRFTRKNGKPDVDKAAEEVMEAYRLGVNYFDTAYIYPGSEEALGKILERTGIRDRINIATKLPHYLIRKKEDPERFFTEELRRLKTDHIDFYLMHMLTDDKEWERVCGLGIREWIEEKKKTGAIRRIGFSYHGNSDTFIKILNAYDWDFCMIQYNYMDETSQAGVTGLKAAHEKGIPVMIMEPLRGGRLSNALPKAALELFRKQPVVRTPAEWSFRWLFDQEEVTCVLSGMNSMEMIRENARIASVSEAGMITEEERAVYEEARKLINEKIRVGCTGCRYCMPCPHQVDIPGTFSAYNRVYTDSLASGLKAYFMTTVLRNQQTRLTNCVGCGACEKHCPQSIEIRKELKNAGKILENPLVRAAAKAAPHIVKY